MRISIKIIVGLLNCLFFASEVTSQVLDSASVDPMVDNEIEILGKNNNEKRYLLAQNAQQNIKTNFSLERLSRKLRDLFKNAN